jgi:hypothetical protein
MHPGLAKTHFHWHDRRDGEDPGILVCVRQQDAVLEEGHDGASTIVHEDPHSISPWSKPLQDSCGYLSCAQVLVLGRHPKASRMPASMTSPSAFSTARVGQAGD